MFCKNCGKMLDGTENFCGGCGMKIKREMPPAESVAAPHPAYDRRLDTAVQSKPIRRDIPGLAYDRQPSMKEQRKAIQRDVSDSTFDRQSELEEKRQDIRQDVPDPEYDRQSMPEGQRVSNRRDISNSEYYRQPTSEEQREHIRQDVSKQQYYRQPASEGQRESIRQGVHDSTYYRQPSTEEQIEAVQYDNLDSVYYGQSNLEKQRKPIQNNAYAAPYYGQSAMPAPKEEGLFKNGMFMIALICCSINIILQLIGAITETGGYGLILNSRTGVHVSEVGAFIITLLGSVPSILILLGLWIAFLQVSGGISFSVVGNMIRWVVADIGYAIVIIAMLIFGIAGNDLLRQAGYYIRIGNAKDTILAAAFIGILIILIIAVLTNLYYAKLNQALRYARGIMELPPAGRRPNGMTSVSILPPKIGYIRVMWVLMAIRNLGGIFMGIGALDKLGSLFLVIAYILLTVWITGCRSRLESELWNQNI